jgi:hypothetical protein
MSFQEPLARIHSLAIAAAVLLAAGVVTILALDRIGAPEGLVGAVGPIIVLTGAVVVGLARPNADVGAFLAAGRSVPALYAGLAITAIVAGMVLCLYGGAPAYSDPPPLGLAAGVALGGIVLGPLLRGAGVTAPRDQIAARFSVSLATVAGGIAAWTSGALTALAGYRVAVDVILALLPASRPWAETIVGAAIFLIVAPGGLAGVIWVGAASGGALAIVLAAAFGFSWTGSATSLDSVAGLFPAPLLPDSRPTVAGFIASALAAAAFLAAQPAVLAGRDRVSSVRAGVTGWGLCALVAAAALSVLPALSPDASGGAWAAAQQSLVGAAMLAAALALAGAGAYGTCRAVGRGIDTPHRLFPTPASVRLARMRGAVLALLVLCAVGDSHGVPDPRNALVLAMAVALAVMAPLLALAAIGRVGPLSASVAALVAVATGVARASAVGWPASAAETFQQALLAAAAAFVAGAIASLVAPRRGSSRAFRGFDASADAARSAEKQPPRLLMHATVAGGENASAPRRGVAVPGRDHAARSLDDRDERDDVVRL